MKNRNKTKQQLVAENEELRRRLKELEIPRNGAGSGDNRYGFGHPQWHSLVANAPVVILVVDENQCIRFINHTDSGESTDPVLGKPLREFCRPEDREGIRKCVEQVFRTGKPCSCECSTLRLDGQHHWYASHFGPIFADGRVIAVSLISSNITKQKQAEKELATSRAVLQAAIDSLPFDLGALGLDGRYMLQNAASRANWGEAVGRLPEEICTNKHDLAIWQENHRRALAGEKLEAEVELTIKGRKRFCHHVTVPIWDGGNIRGVLGVNMDITEAKLAQEALKEARDELEQRVVERTAELSAANDQLRIFRMFAEASSQGVAMADMNGLITYMNPALCRMAGVARTQDAIGKHLSTYCAERNVPDQEREIPSALVQNGRWEGTLFSSIDGKTTYVLQNSFLIKDENGNPSHLAAVITDITEHKRTEEALRASEERFRSYFEQGLIGMAVSSPEKRWLEVNDRLCEILGYSRAELLGTKWTDLTHPDDLESSVGPQERLLADEIEHYTIDKRFLRKDGREVHAAMFVRCFRRTDGAVDHILALIDDTTERRKAQQAVERERQSLWRMLQASDHERQIISYEIHDGLAQYLAAARMQFQAHEAFRENSPDKAKKAYQTAIELVCQAHAETRRLISDVRPPVIDENGLETAISHLVHEQRQHGRPKIEFRSSVQFGRLPVILENSLYRIGQEALTNACRHSKSKNVNVTLVQEGQDVRLEVQDWGIGFDPQSVEKGHFGLEGIRQRVRLLGGHLTIESAPGSGALVQAVVPILEKQNPESSIG